MSTVQNKHESETTYGGIVKRGTMVSYGSFFDLPPENSYIGADFAEIGHRFRCKLATVTGKLAGLSERSDAGTNGQFSS